MQIFGKLKEKRVRRCDFCNDRIPANTEYTVVGGEGKLMVTCQKCVRILEVRY